MANSHLISYSKIPGKTLLFTVKWMRSVGEFKRGHMNTNNTERSGRQKDVTTPRIIEKIHEIVLDDPKVKVRELTKATGISIGPVVEILHGSFGMRKLTALPQNGSRVC